jgi:hypothetical protein
MRKVGLLLALSLVLGAVVSAQGLSSPKVEVFLGYQYEHVTYDNLGLSGYNTNGFAGQFVYYPTSWVGIVGDAGVGFVRNLNGFSASGNLQTYMAGPKVGFEHGPIHPYAQFLIGVAHLSSGLMSDTDGYEFYTGGPVSSGGQPDANGWAFSFGGGVDARLTHHVYVRLGELDYLGTHFNDPFGDRFRQNNFQYKAGLVFRF